MERRSRALMVLCLSILPLSTPAARADLECAQPVVEKGEVRSGVSLAHRFSFVNRGSEAVEITDVRPSCGCLTPKLEYRRLLPGETGELVLEVNTLTQPAGANSWRVTIRYTAGGVEKELPLYVAARIVTEISVEPPSLAIYTDKAITHDITIIDRRTEPLIVRSVQASSPYIVPHLGELHRNDAGHWVRSIQVEVAADCPYGNHAETLLVCTSDATYPELTVPFTVVKRPRQQVSAAPSAVNLVEVHGQPLPSRIVLLSAADDEEVKIDRVECEDAAIECRWAQGPGHRATLKIRIDPSRRKGDTLQSAVHVHLSRPGQQTIMIPVNCSPR
jgi:hypothetical protein